MPEQPTNEQYNPLALFAIVIGALLLFAVFFIGFLVAPLAILLVFYVVYSAMDRSKKSGGGHAPAEAEEEYDDEVPDTAADRLAREAAQRRAVMERMEPEPVAGQTDRPGP
ncbi:hypothetical protein DSM112329_05129 [Paraconexibacter sp. AEG42_29]|uniref:Uncharacterized protein n=1 Tax=Paraconexibacter sp. AEG42_29 TaxID=2997339 RepID=A0AAU7B2I5_9ACTN